MSALVPYQPSGTPSPSSTTSPKDQGPKRYRTTKDGHCRPPVLRSSPVAPDQIQATRTPAGNSAVALGFAWIKNDLGERAASWLLWLLHCAPLLVHVVWICGSLAMLYLLARPQLLVRMMVFCTEHAFRIATTSGSDLILELDRVLLDQSSNMVSSISRADPIAWAQSTLFAKPSDFSSLFEDAVSQATASLTPGNSSREDVAAAMKVAAKLAIDETTRQLSTEVPVLALSSEAPAGAGFMILLFSSLTIAKAGKLLL